MKLYLFMVLEGSICTLLYLFFNYAFPYEMSLRKRLYFLRGNMLFYLMPLPWILARCKGVLRVLLDKWGILQPLGQLSDLTGTGEETGLSRPNSLWNGMIVKNRESRLICLTGFGKQLPFVLGLAGMFLLFLIGWMVVYHATNSCYRQDVIYVGVEKRGRRQVRIGRSPHISTPITVGMLHPVVLFPAERKDFDITNKGIVNHELEHIVNRDNVFRFLSYLTIAFAWYNPLTYYLLREHVAVSEMLCDEAAVCGMEKREKADYMRSILEAVGKSGAPETVVMNLGKTKGLSRKRLEKIMDKNARKPWKGNLAGAILVVSFLMSGIPAYAYEEPVILQELARKPLTGEIWDRIDQTEFIPLSPDGTVETHVLFDWYMLDNYERYKREFWFQDPMIDPANLPELDRLSLSEGCNHHFVTGVYSVHIPRANGGCRVIGYHAWRCEKCGMIEKGWEELSSMYDACIH